MSKKQEYYRDILRYTLAELRMGLYALAHTNFIARMFPFYKRKVQMLLRLSRVVDGIHVALTEPEYGYIDVHLNCEFRDLWNVRKSMQLKTGHLIAALAGKIAAEIPESMRRPQHWSGPKPAHLQNKKREQAFAIANQCIQEMSEKSEIELVLMEERSQEISYGWIICVESRQYLETYNIMYEIVGNSPFIVDLELDHIEHLPNGSFFEYSLLKYRCYRQYKIFLRWIKKLVQKYKNHS